MSSKKQQRRKKKSAEGSPCSKKNIRGEPDDESSVAMLSPTASRSGEAGTNQINTGKVTPGSSTKSVVSSNDNVDAVHLLSSSESPIAKLARPVGSPTMSEYLMTEQQESADDESPIHSSQPPSFSSSYCTELQDNVRQNADAFSAIFHKMNFGGQRTNSADFFLGQETKKKQQAFKIAEFQEPKSKEVGPHEKNAAILSKKLPCGSREHETVMAEMKKEMAAEKAAAAAALAAKKVEVAAALAAEKAAAEAAFAAEKVAAVADWLANETESSLIISETSENKVGYVSRPVCKQNKVAKKSGL